MRKRYSTLAQRLAQELAEKAARNLRRSGWTVTKDPATGLWTTRRPS